MVEQSQDGGVSDEKRSRSLVNWVELGRYKALTSESTTVIRTKEAQTPDSLVKTEILKVVWNHFKEAPIAFEAFAAALFQMHDQRVIIDEITRASVDGGRDAVGRYRLGLVADPVYADFSLEAKCYTPPVDDLIATSVGVKEVSRLISRLRHRQFGVLPRGCRIGLIVARYPPVKSWLANREIGLEFVWLIMAEE